MLVGHPVKPEKFACVHDPLAEHDYCSICGDKGRLSSSLNRTAKHVYAGTNIPIDLLAQPFKLRCKLLGHKGQIVSNTTNSAYCTLICTRCGKCKQIRL